MKILLLMQWFDPEPQLKGLSFAKKLRNLGNQVEVLTGFPNYPGGTVYPGYKIKLYDTEIMDGIRVMRTPLYPSHDTSAFGRILNYVSFGISSLFAGVLLVKRPEVIYACGPPVTVGVAATIIGLFKQTPVVYDIQDLWPDSLTATGMFRSKIGLKIVDKICMWVYMKSTHITVQSPGVRDYLIARGVLSTKISVIFNWCDEDSIISHLNKEGVPSEIPEEYKRSSSFDVLFAGNMGKAQDIDTILEAASLLQNEDSNIRIFLMGGGVEVPRLKNVVNNKKLNNINFLLRVPMSEVGEFLARADCLLVHLKDCPLFRITIPAKVQAYMAVGKPIVMAIAGDASNLIIESKSGVCALPSNARSIADAIKKIAYLSPNELKKMGDNGLTYYYKNMSLDSGVKNFIEVFNIAIKA